jgi:hypothetical protein
VWPVEKIRLGLSTRNVVLMPFYYARDKKLFDKYGLDVEIIQIRSNLQLAGLVAWNGRQGREISLLQLWLLSQGRQGNLRGATHQQKQIRERSLSQDPGTNTDADQYPELRPAGDGKRAKVASQSLTGARGGPIGA